MNLANVKINAGYVGNYCYLIPVDTFRSPLQGYYFLENSFRCCYGAHVFPRRVSSADAV